MDLEKIHQLIRSAAQSIDNNEQLATPFLIKKLHKCCELYPHDQTLGSMTRVLERMASNNNLLIKKADLKSLYQKLYSRNTKFAELFKDELGLVDSFPSPTVYNRDEAVNVKPYQVEDQILSNALTSMFDKTTPKMYSQNHANRAIFSVNATLDAWQIKPNSLTVEDGNDKFLVLKATYESPKGKTSFLVPVEIQKNKVLEASTFLGNTGLEELNHVNVKTYLTTFAGNKNVITATNILQTLTKAATEQRNISDTEMALTRLQAMRQEQGEFFQNQILGQKVAEAGIKEVVLPRYEDFASFEKQFTSPYGKAFFQFGDKVVTASEHIVRELKSFGHKNPQINIAKCDEHTIFYNVALDAGRVGFTVPVKVANNKIVKPSLMLCNGSISPFSREGINSLYVNNQSDYKAAAVASPQFSSKPSELINNIREAVMEENHAKAEDALNVLAQSGDAKAYATGFQIYLQGLSKKEASPTTKCAMAIKTNASEHLICAHTNLPIHKVYQDKDGNCRPLYRKGMDETYEGASFMNAKIFG